MGTFDSEERLRRLELRLDKIESRLGIHPPAIPPPPLKAHPPASVAPSASIAPPPVPRPAPVPIAPPRPVIIRDKPAEAEIPEWMTLGMPSISQAHAPPPVTPPPPPRPAPPPSAPMPSVPKWRALEQTLGLKWTGWVGAIVLIFGAVMGVQFAYAHDWFTHIPPGVRLAAIFLAGFALIASGEFVIRRVHPIPAASLFGAGVATLFVGAYVGYAYFDLYSRTTSMSLMAFSTLIGAGVAMRGNMVSIAVLSLVGANVAPLILKTPNPPVVPFLFYLLSMEFVALFLAQWGRGGRWWTLRGLSLVPAVIWMGGILDSPHHAETAVLTFMLVYAALYHAELILAALRAGEKNIARHAPTAFAICVTAALTLGVLAFFVDSTNAVRAGWVIGLAAFSAVFGFGLPKKSDALVRLATAHRIAAAALLILAVPVATSGVRIEVGWAILAVGFAAAWRLARSPISRGAAPVAWLLGIAHLVLTILTDNSPTGPTWITLFGTAIGANAILAWMFATTGHVVVNLIIDRNSERSRRDAHLLSVLAGFLFVAAAIGGLPPLGATGCILFYAWLLLGADKLGAQPNLAVSACGVLILATVKWAILDTLSARFSPNWVHTPPVFNSLMLVGLLACVSLLGFYKLNRAAVQRTLSRGGDVDRPLWALCLSAAVIVLVTVGFSFEIDRIVARLQADVWHAAISPVAAEQLSFTILWSVSVCALLALARFIGSPEDRGRWINRLWVLAALLAAKFFIVDTFMPWFDGPAKVWPVLNLQVLAGAAVLTSLVLSRLLITSECAEQADSRDIRWRIGLLATALLAWMGTLEIDRFVAQLGLPSGSYGLDWHLKNLGWTIWWCLVVGGSLLVWRRIDRNSPGDHPWQHLLPAILSLIAAQYLAVDCVSWRFMHQPVTGWWVILNFDVLTAAVVLGGVFLPRLAKINSSPSQRQFEGALCIAILLTAGTLEVDRTFNLPSVRASLNDANLAEQVGLSIFWSSFAVLSLAAGFWKLIAPLRYFALGLLGFTLFKVVFVDLSQIGYGYRILSFIGLGLLLLFTSVMYGKISPLLLSRPLPDNGGRGS